MLPVLPKGKEVSQEIWKIYNSQLTINVSLRCEWQSPPISQSAHANQTNHSLNWQFYPTVQNHFIFSKLTHRKGGQVDHTWVREQNIKLLKHVGTATLCQTLHQWEEHSLSRWQINIWLAHSLWVENLTGWGFLHGLGLFHAGCWRKSQWQLASPLEKVIEPTVKMYLSNTESKHMKG